MTSYKNVWKSPLRIGTSIGVALMYFSCWVNGYTMVDKLFFAGLAVILITIILFVDGITY
jgi:hypothetical protein